MPNQHEVFLSYCWNDNTATEVLDGRQSRVGWVEYLQHRLTALLALYRGVKTGVWRDARDLHGNFQLSVDVRAALESATLLVTVLSRSYVRAPWCMDEKDQFCQRLRSVLAGEEWKRHVFHLFRTPIDPEAMTSEVADGKHYEFFERRGPALTDHVPFEPKRLDLDTPFDRAVTELASDLARQLSTLRPPRQGNVYLSKPVLNLQNRCQSLRTQLKDLGFDLLPDVALPEANFEATVRAQIPHCDACIFLIDAEPAPWAGLDPTEVEFNLLLEVCDPVEHPVLAWVSPAAKPTRSFARDLAAGRVIKSGLEVRRSEFGYFMTDALQWLKMVRDRQRDTLRATEASPARCALLYDRCDEGNPTLAELKISLSFLLPYEVTLPHFQGDPAQLRELERQRFRDSTCVVLFSGASSEKWLEVKCASLKAEPGQPGRKVGILLAGEGSVDKRAVTDDFSGWVLLLPAGPLDGEARHWLQEHLA